MKIYLKGILILMFLFLVVDSYGQDNQLIRQKQEQKAFYRQTLQVDSLKAAEVTEIQAVYKSEFKALMADTSLKPAWRYTRFRQLMDQKNQKLRKILTPEQQKKIIPESELKPEQRTQGTKD